MPQIHKLTFALLWIAIFSVCAASAHAGSYKQLYGFKGGLDGAQPLGRLIAVGRLLFGTTSQGGNNSNTGTVFSINPNSGKERIVYTFVGDSILKPGGDGANPYAGLLDLGGLLYGTTYFGGHGADYSNGIVFSVNPKTDTENVVLFFGGTGGALPSASLINVGGILYGTTRIGNSGYGLGNGAVFSLNPNTGAETVIHYFSQDAEDPYDGQNPQGVLLNVAGTLYGTTTYGGTTDCPGGNACGTVFSVNLATGNETVVHAFKGGNDGAFPTAGLIKVGNLLYGTTATGGSANCSSAYGAGCGTIFTVNPSTGAEVVKYAFTGGADGAAPTSDLLNVGGVLYGVAQGGGGHKSGVIFSVNPTTGKLTVVYSFKGGADGAYPVAGLVNVLGTIYGTTQNGGNGSCSNGCGTVFSYQP